MSSNMIPQHLQIRVMHADDDIVVIDKPANLRSVPGHADSPTDTTIKLKRPSDRLTAVEAWIQAIKSIPDDDDSYKNEAIKELLHNIRTTNNLSSIPRKLEPFARYVFRNRNRLLPSHVDDDPDSSSNNEPPQKMQRKDSNLAQNTEQSYMMPPWRNVADEAFSIIQQLHKPLMNLPTPTEDWESAQGQLRLRGYGDFTSENSYNSPATNSGSEKSNLHVVHRLDCQTSGVMVFARNAESASKLCKAWRERDAVQKTYLAHVMCWPPYSEQNVEEGTIELPLAASRTERIKWEVRQLCDGGKPSVTKWKLYKGEESGEESMTKEGVILELHPITGRTHQLRIHCAEIGSGIIGDSLYGDSPVPWVNETDQQKDPDQSGTDASKPAILRLHAYMLAFRHPRSGDELTFIAPKLW
ncbi:hypothetical protein ACHAXM_004947 [Skeletonema potamos]